MRRLTYLASALLVSFALAACSAEVSDADQDTAPPPPQAEPVAAQSTAQPAKSEAASTFDPKAVFPKWYEPIEPFRVMDNLYYVGSVGLAVWFLPTPEGHIVIDGGAPETAALIISGIKTLGYDPSDIAILLNTHAHFDHSGGLAELKAVSGAKMIASEGDRSALEGGFYLGSESEPVLNAPPVRVNQIIADGETIRLGGTELTANLTPGHSRGCTSWTLSLQDSGVSYDAVIFCSVTVAANRLVTRPQYPGIVEDYRATLARISTWTPDIFLSNHPEFFGMGAKRAALKAGDPLAFVDRESFPVFAKRMQASFEKALAEQTNVFEE